MTHYFLNIGSNLGNRKLNISKALRALEAKFGYFETSHIVESAPWGYLSANRYANIAVMIVSEMEPEEVLTVLKQIEASVNKTPHRNEKGEYSDRELDIDIMAADGMEIDTPAMTIPHARLAERRFFLEPFAELAPLWHHPATGLTCQEMIERLRPLPDGQNPCASTGGTANA